jgi:hypothetical protein
MIPALLIVLLSGVCYRIRGSEAFSAWKPLTLPFGIVWRRDRLVKQLISGAPRGLGVWLFAPWPYALAAWLLSALADTWPHSKGEGFGGPGDLDPSQAIIMAEAGFMSALPVIAGFIALGYLSGEAYRWAPMAVALCAGLAEPAAYWLGWHTPAIGKQGDPYWRRLLTGTEWAELYTGLLLGLFVLGAV